MKKNTLAPIEGKKPRKLSLKQRRWLDLYLETGNASEAAMVAYECKTRESAGQIGWENLKKLERPIQELMDLQGITDAYLNIKLKEGMDATKNISAVVGTDANDRTMDFVEVPDYAVRHKYVETAYKVKKKFDSQPGTVVNQQFNFNHAAAKDKDAFEI